MCDSAEVRSSDIGTNLHLRAAAWPTFDVSADTTNIMLASLTTLRFIVLSASCHRPNCFHQRYVDLSSLLLSNCTPRGARPKDLVLEFELDRHRNAKAVDFQRAAAVAS